MEAHLYEEMARVEDHHWWFRGRRAVIRSVLRQRLGAGSARRILDVGCGTGSMLPLLREFGSVEGLDGSAAALAYARARLGDGVRLHQGQLPGALPPGPFDVVTAFDVLEHLPQPVETLREVRAALAPGGRVVLAVPAFGFLWSHHDVVHHHLRRYTLPTLRAHVEAAGLRLTWHSYFNSVLFAPVAAVRVAQRLLPTRGGPATSHLELGPRWLNATLEALFSAEARVLPRVRLPFGVSLFAIAEPG